MKRAISIACLTAISFTGGGNLFGATRHRHYKRHYVTARHAKRKSVERVGVGAAGGAVVGALVGGGKGAAIGAAAGGATGYAYDRHKKAHGQ